MTLAVQSLPLQPSRRTELGDVYRLADHLDATLAMGEDLLRRKLDVAVLVPGDTHAQITKRNQAISEFSRGVRALELGIVSRLMQARTRAVELRSIDTHFAPILGLFIGGTAALTDAASRAGGLGDISPAALIRGPDVLQFLTSRSVLVPGATSLAAVPALAVTEDYLLANEIHLGTLLDMVAQLLETLDLAFDLYAEPRKFSQ